MRRTAPILALVALVFLLSAPDVRGAGGVRLAVRVFDAPAGAPGLLLHHGLASSSHIWDLMLPRLTRRFRVVAYDARGHGLSAKPTSGYGFDRTAVDAVAVIRATRLRRPAMAGHSWGANVALEVAARYPRALSGAVFVDGAVAGLARSFSWAEVKENLAPPRLAGMPVDEFRGMIRSFFSETVEVTPDVETIVLSVMRVGGDGRIRPQLSRANHFRILHAIWEQDPAARYEGLRVPALVILARSAAPTHDELEFLAVKREAASRIRRLAAELVRVSWMEGIHDLPLQRPGALSSRIERFADDVVG